MSVLTLSIAVSTVSLAIAAIRTDFHTLFACFVLYEIGCGAYFPTMGTLRSSVLPEQHRTALMNWYDRGQGAIGLT